MVALGLQQSSSNYSKLFIFKLKMHENNTHKSASQQHQIEQLMSNKIIIEQTDDDKRFVLSQLDKQDFSNMEALFEVDRKEKQEFFQASDFKEFVEMLVIQQPFVNLMMNMEKAISKTVRNILLKNEYVESKEHFLRVKSELVKIFQNDIQVGYITSTGQVKVTAYIYVVHRIFDQLVNQQVNVNFKKIELKITTSFFALEYQDYINHKLPKLSPKPRAVSSTLFDSAKKKRLESQIESGESQQEVDVIQQMFPICHKNYKIKQSFIRNGKFANEFLVLRESNEDMKDGITISFVYRALDDQIYAVKKSALCSKVLTFYDVFSTMALGEMSADQRKIREAKILAKLAHPNILRLYDWWIEEGGEGYSLYMLLEYCSFPGYKHQTNDLLNYSYYYLNPMANDAKVATIRTIMLQIIDALEYIHLRGIVHRDLKPENIFVTVDITGDLRVVIADFDQGKDVRESKLSIITEEKIPELELNSIKSKNTICSGTSGYTTQNSLKNQAYDQSDEFYALGVTLLHLVIAFPGEPKNRNHYATTFAMSDIEDVLLLFDNWANKFVKNKTTHFSFAAFQNQLQLARQLIDKKLKRHDQIRQIVSHW